MTYRIRKVDATDEDIAEELHALHDACFGNEAPRIEAAEREQGHWWFAYVDQPDHVEHKKPAAFAGLKPSSQWTGVGYLCRAGVIPWHRGKGLQRRLIRVREQKAQKIGYEYLVTDTTANVSSANNLMKAGYRLYVPTFPWGYSHTLYWRKRIVKSA